MIDSKHRYFAISFCALLVGLAGCGGSGSAEPVASSGSFSLGISDAPISGASKVCIAFTEIEFQGAGASTVVPVSDTINLLQFQGANSFPLLVNEALEPGQYQWLRLGVDAVRGSNGGLGDGESPVDGPCAGSHSYIVIDGAATNLYVPSGAESGLKLIGGFTVPAGGSADFTAEFDLLKSITAPNGLEPDVVLRPTIRLVNNVEVGTLTGQVSGGLINPADQVAEAACDPWVHVFDDGPGEGGPLVADDSFASAMVSTEINSAAETEHNYTIGFLLAGDYKAAFTCNGTDFEPAAGLDVTISARTVTTVDFPGE